MQFALDTDRFYKSGDYWLIPARHLTGDIDWPTDNSGPLAQPPLGIQHHYTALALLDLSASGKWSVIGDGDLRTRFKPITVGLLSKAGDIVEGSLRIVENLQVDSVMSGAPNSEEGLIVDGDLTIRGNLNVAGQATEVTEQQMSGNITLGDGDDTTVTVEGELKTGHSSGLLQVRDPLHLNSPLTVAGITAGNAEGDAALDVQSDGQLPLRVFSNDGDGTRLRIENASKGGPDGLDGREWELISTGVGNTGGAGHLLFSPGEVLLSRSGDVGIGTRAPNAKLDVDGNIRFSGNLQTATIAQIAPIYIRGTGKSGGGADRLVIGNSVVYNGGGIGLRLTIINKADHSVASTTQYNTYGNTDAADKLATALNTMNAEQLGVLTSFDAWEAKMNDSLKAAFKRIGLYKGLGTPIVGWRRPYAAIFEASSTTSVGTAKVVEVLNGNASTDPAEIRGWLLDGSFVATGAVPNALATSDGKQPAVLVDETGNVSIATEDPEGFQLRVDGNLHANRYVVQNGVDGGTSRGIWLWNASNNAWGLYMGTSGDTKSLAGGTAVAGAGFTSHALRLRTGNGEDKGIVFENSAEELNLSVRGSDGLTYIRGDVGMGTTGPVSKLTVNENIAQDNSYDGYGDAPLTIFEPTGNGGNTPNGTRDILNLVREGVNGQAYGNKASLAIGRYENNGVNARTQLDIKLTDGNFDEHNTIMSFRSNGHIGIGTDTPAEKLEVSGGNIKTDGKFIGTLYIPDTRDVDDAPTAFGKEVAFDFKRRDTVGVPGSGNFSGMMTIAPWHNNSGDAHHQLNFNEGGLFWRQGQPQNEAWGSWARIPHDGLASAFTFNGEVSIMADSKGVVFSSGNFGNGNTTDLFFNKDDVGFNQSEFVLYNQNNNITANRYFQLQYPDDAGGLTIRKGGNIGIHTTTPLYPLHVDGKILSGARSGAYPDWIDYDNSNGLFVSSGSDNAFFGLKNRDGADGGGNNYDTVIYWGDDTADDLVFETQDKGEVARITGDGEVRGKMWYSEEYTWTEGMPPIPMEHSDSCVAFLTYVHGDFNGWGEKAFVAINEDDGYWYLFGQGNGHSITAKARCMGMPSTDAQKAARTTDVRALLIWAARLLQ